MTVQVGFTGSQKGMTPAQRVRLYALLGELGTTDLHHGDCIGADHQAHLLAGVQDVIRLHVHPPKVKAKRAFCFGYAMYDPKDYLVRNRHIVDATEVLIAAPAEMTEQMRGGTWMTVRYARKQGKRVIIILPDGSEA